MSIFQCHAVILVRKTSRTKISYYKMKWKLYCVIQKAQMRIFQCHRLILVRKKSLIIRHLTLPLLPYLPVITKLLVKVHCYGKIIPLQCKNLIFQYCDGVMIGKWNGKEEVLYISTEFTNHKVEYVNKRGRRKDKPQPILEYNKHMRDIDIIQDQMMEYYPCSGITLQWYKKLAVHIIQQMLSNSHLLYNKFSGKKMTFYNFRLKVIEELLKISREKTEKRTSKPMTTEHLPTKIPDLSKKGETKRKRCRMCVKRKVRKDTIYYCEKCPEKPGLCLGDCFLLYHKQT